MTTVRLLKAFRGYRAGETIRIPDGLAGRLFETGVAAIERQTELIPGAAERAVAGADRQTATTGVPRR